MPTFVFDNYSKPNNGLPKSRIVLPNRKQNRKLKNYTYLISDGQKEAWDMVFKNKKNWHESNEYSYPSFLYGSH